MIKAVAHGACSDSTLRTCPVQSPPLTYLTYLLPLTLSSCFARVGVQTYAPPERILTQTNVWLLVCLTAGYTAGLRRDYEYKRLGALSMLAALDLHDGHIIAQVHERHRSREFVLLLKKEGENHGKNRKGDNR